MVNGSLKGGKLLVVTLVITIFLFGLTSVIEAKEINNEETKDIQDFLNIANVPGLRNYSGEEFKKLLNKVIEPEIPDITYGLLVLSAKDDLEWIDMILSQDFLGKNREYFNSILDKRLDLLSHWKGVAQDIYFFKSKGNQVGPLSGLASEIVSITNKTIEIFVAFNTWKTTKIYRGIWRYFDARRYGYTHEEAWGDAKVEMMWAIKSSSLFGSTETNNNQERQLQAQFAELWNNWGPYATPWGISEEYKKQVRNELTDTLVVAAENQSLAEKEKGPSLLDRLVSQFKKIKDTAIVAIDQINPFKAGPITDLPEDIITNTESQTIETQEELETSEIEIPLVEEPEIIKVESQLVESETQPIIDEVIEELIETEPIPVEETELDEIEISDEPQEAEETIPEEATEPENTKMASPSPSIEPEPEPENETTPELVFCERGNGNPSRFRVLINEIAWMGTAESSNDEWIELRNIWSMPVDLAGWQLIDKDKQIKIVFGEEDVVPANGFYVLERTDDDTLPNVTAGFIYTGALNNTDEALYLFDNNCRLEDEVVASPNWPAGDNIERRSMERMDLLNWYTSNSAGTAGIVNSPPPIPSSSSASTPEPEPEPTSQSEQPLLAVVINEIAWMGTGANSADEWIELYNDTTSDVDVTGWRLAAADGSPDITLPTSTISAGSFYLIERTDDDTVSDIPADYFGSFGYGLSNDGESLELRDADNTLIDIVDCSGGWFGGEATPDYVSMERTDPQTSGSDSNNWANNNRVPWEGWQGKDANGDRINGTPKSKNSISKNSTTISSGGFTINNDFTLKLLGSPYLVEGSINVSTGANLTIEPGVTVKFKHSEYWHSELKIEGGLEAIGGEAESEKIAFTSSSTQPAAGDWEWLYFKDAQAHLKNVIVSYAGKKEGSPPESSPFTWGAIYIDGGEVIIESSLIEASQTLGVWLKNSSATIVDRVEFSAIEGDWEEPAAVYIENSGPTIRNSTFKNNNTGIWIEAEANPLIENNVFEENVTPIKTLGLLPSFSNNSTQNNDYNGILVTGLGFSEAIDQINWQEADLPYILEGSFTIASGQTLNVQPGVIVKFKSESRILADGILDIKGTQNKKIVFTSLADDEYGGDTNNDGTDTSAYAGYWDFISFSASSINSIIDNAIIRYGGWYNQPFKSGAIKIENININIFDSLFENNLVAGLELENCTTTITNTTFDNHQVEYGYSEEKSTGIFIKNATPIFSNVVFSNNYYGIYIEPGECPDLVEISFGEEDKANSIDIWPENCKGD